MDRIVVRDVIVGVIVAVIGGLIVTMVTAFTMHVHALELFSLVGVIVVVCAFLIVLLYSRYSPSVQPPPQPDAASPSPSVVKVLSLGVKGCLSVAALAVIGVVATIGLGIILGSQSNNNNGNNNNNLIATTCVTPAGSCPLPPGPVGVACHCFGVDGISQ